MKSWKTAIIDNEKLPSLTMKGCKHIPKPPAASGSSLRAPGDCSAISSQLTDVREIRPWFQCFVALRGDQTAILWGRGQASHTFRNAVSVGVTKFGVAALSLGADSLKRSDQGGF